MKDNYITTRCNVCGDEYEVWKFSLTRKDRPSTMCRKCANKIAAEKRTDKDRDAVYLKKQLRNIKARCSGKYSHYKSYTKKGISVFDEWVNNPNSFVEWAKNNGWSKGLTIDRIDNNGNYEPSNCRWIMVAENTILKESDRKPRGKSKYVGVWFREDTNKWSSEIRILKKKKSLGCFDSEYDAMIARDRYILDNGILHLKLNELKRE